PSASRGISFLRKTADMTPSQDGNFIPSYASATFSAPIPAKRRENQNHPPNLPLPASLLAPGRARVERRSLTRVRSRLRTRTNPPPPARIGARAGGRPAFVAAVSTARPL